MDESSLNIRVDGDSTGAVQAFDALDNSVNAFGGQLDDVKKQMTSPYEHAGLFLFSRQILGMVGLSDVARHTMGAITIAFEDVATAAGTTVAAIAPYLLGIGLVIVGVEKFVKAHKEAAQSTDDLVKSEDDSLKSTRELQTAFDDYKKKVGELPPELRAVELATQNLTKAQSALMALDLQKQLDETSKKIAETAAAFDPAINATAGQAAALDRFQAGSKEAATAATAVTHVLDEQAKSTAALTMKATELQERLKHYADTGDLSPLADRLKAASSAADDNAKAIDKVNASWQKWITSADDAMDKVYQSEIKLSNETLRLGDEDAAFTADAWDRKSAAAKRSLDATLASIEQTYRKADADARRYGLSDVDLTSQYEASKAAARKLYLDQSDADARAYFGLQATLDQGFEQAGVTAFNQLASGVSSSFAKMAVEGKAMQQNLRQVFQSLAESFIAAVGEMMIKWAAFQTMTGMFSFGAGAVGGAPTGASSGAAATFGGGAGTTPNFMGEFATGGDFLVNGRSSFIAGESGLERVQITPGGASAPSGGGGGGDTYISISVPGSGDPSAVAQKVLDFIMQQTKGRGQVNPIGPSIYGR